MKPEQARTARPAVQLEKVYPHAPERVWQALTDPKAVAQWLLPTTFKPLVGHRFRFTRLSKGGKRRNVHCQVVELEAPRRLAYTWQAEDEDAPSLVTWTLEPVEAGTCLRLEHTGLETSCAYQARGDNSDVSSYVNSFVDNFADSLADLLSSGGLKAGRRIGRYRPSTPVSTTMPHPAQTGQIRVGRIALHTSAQPTRCVSRRVTRDHSRDGVAL